MPTPYLVRSTSKRGERQQASTPRRAQAAQEAVQLQVRQLELKQLESGPQWTLGQVATVANPSLNHTGLHRQWVVKAPKLEVHYWVCHLTSFAF